MNEERRQVLEMLAAGRITVEQAASLLEAVEPQGERRGDSAYAGERRQEGRSARRPPRLTPSELAGFKALGVNAAYLQEMREAGYGDLSPEQLSQLKALGVTASYVRELREAGYDNLSPDDLAGLKALGVNSSYVREISGLDFGATWSGRRQEAAPAGSGENVVRDAGE